uniref:Phosphodiesterase n=2 Tax=Cacopsylla melanoneura TaxID=428564 RepID=A0A8D8WKA7_9HEMI
MTQLSFPDVEEWLETHPDQSQDYFLRKMGVTVINKWLQSHGFACIENRERFMDNDSSRRGSSTSGNLSPNSPGGDKAYLGGEENNNSLNIPSIVLNNGTCTATIPPEGGLEQRRNSKKCLRHDFAKAKNKCVFRTHEIIGNNPDARSISASRRSSLIDMRKYTSLPPSSLSILSLLIESKIKIPHCPYNQFSRSCKKDMLRQEGERDFFMAIVRDIARDLDLKSLSKKTLDNVSVLLDADGASLFFVERKRGGKKCLVSKVFDLHSGAGLVYGTDDQVEVPWGTGILGHVATTGETVNLQIACEDPRFDDEVDALTGYHTETLLCMPVRNDYDEIIAVSQVINKNPDRDGGHFTGKDEKIFETYLKFVGIAITNARVVESARREYDRNRKLLEVVHDLFEEQTSIEQVVVKIMQRAQSLLKCENAAVLLIDESSSTVKFTKLFELDSLFGQSSNNSIMNPKLQVERSNVSQYLLGIAEKVAITEQVVNIYESVDLTHGSGGKVKSILAMPIRNKHYKVTGVATIINKNSGLPFDEFDQELFEAFTIFCGLGINNTIMYSEVEKAMTRQKVSLEVLSYHTKATDLEVQELMEKPVPEAEVLHLDSLGFNDFSLEPNEMILAAVRMFDELQLINEFNIKREVLYKFLVTIKRNYRQVPYHNWWHAFNVTQMMFSILINCEMTNTFSDLEVLGMVVGCLCHDLDHRGTNNEFQKIASSNLAQLYGTTSTLEYHHFNQAVMILNSEDHNILSSLSSEEYSIVMNALKNSILATDLSTYFGNQSRFFTLISTKTYSWSLEDHRDILRSILMTSADIAASTKPWDIQYQISLLVKDEFFSQGDKERNELKLQPKAMMDRNKSHEWPLMQFQWMNDVCYPLYDALSNMNPKFEILAKGVQENRDKWWHLYELSNTSNNNYDEISCNSSNSNKNDVISSNSDQATSR